MAPAGLRPPPLIVVAPPRGPERPAMFQQANPGVAPDEVFVAAETSGADLEALGDTSLYTPEAIARALAHVALWRRCAQSEAPLTICEDAAVLRSDFGRTHLDLLRRLPEFDYVLWGWDMQGVLAARLAPGVDAAIVAEPALARLALDSFRGESAPPTLLPLVKAVGGVAYTLSPRGARLLLSRALPFRAGSLQLPLTPEPRPNASLDVAVGNLLEQMAAFVSLPPLAIADPTAMASRRGAEAMDRDAALRVADGLQRQGRRGEAVAVLRAAAEASPDSPAVLGRLGAALAGEGRLAAAGAALERAFTLDPADDTTAYNLAALRLREQRPAEALALLEPVVRRSPAFELAQCNVGVALLALGRAGEAEATFRRALALNGAMAEARRGLATALLTTSSLLEQQGEFERAFAAASEAVRLEPQEPGGYNNLGVACLRLGRPEAAEAAYRSALAIAPDHADGHHGLAFALLKQQRYLEAWPEYDWRLKTAPINAWAPAFTRPRWDGRDSPGATLLLATEQGFGDTIMAARFAAKARARVGRVVLLAPRTLAGLLGSLPGIDAVALAEEPVPAHDLWCPVMSLPGLFGVDPGFSPHALPRLQVDAGRRAHWSQMLPRAPIRVGIAWQGNPTARVEHGRSIPLQAFRPLAEIAGVQLVSLQKNAGVEQLDLQDLGFHPHPLGDRYDRGDFAETAAVIANVDLVICCDTSVAHLAGALDKPVWIAIGANPDWRWLDGREDTIWYASARLFRLAQGEAWPALLARMASELAAGAKTLKRAGRP